MFQSEFEFTLPKGYVDADGNIHQQGVMRLATAADEIAPLRDPRVKQNRAYMVIVLLSRVIISLGEVKRVTTAVVENFYAADLEFLQGFYRHINDTGKSRVDVKCPKCEARFEVDPFPFELEVIP